MSSELPTQISTVADSRDSVPDRESTGDTNPRRERRIAARKAHILTAAAQVFAEKGFHGATTRDIAQTADIAEGTIYNYFKNKEELLIAIIEHFASLEAREEIMVHNVDRDIREFFIEHFNDRMKALSPIFSTLMALMPYLMTDATMRQYYYQRVMLPAIEMVDRHIQTRIEHGQFESLDTAFVSRAVIAILLGFQQLLMMEDPITRQYFNNPEQFAATLADILTTRTFKI